MEKNRHNEPPLTKQDLLDALGQVIPPVIKKIDDLRGEMNHMERRLRGEMNHMEERLRADIDKKPDRDEVRKIVREELEKYLTIKTFHLVPTPEDHLVTPNF